ncbi:MAG TPA: glycosyltransferase [Candidatus Angelobacter sp.]
MAAHSPLHVLFLIDHLVERGGGEGNLLKVVQLMPPGQVRCSVATFEIDAEIQKSIPVPVHVLPMRRVYDLGSLRAARQLRQLIRDERVNIVQTYFETSNLWGGLVAKLSGALLLSCRRDLGILRSPKHDLAYRLINRLSDRVLAVSEEVRKFCIGKDRVDPGKITVIYNGVDLRQIAAAGHADGVGSDLAGARHLVTCIANLRHIKGIDLLIQAAQQVCREIPDVVFAIAGSLYESRYVQEMQSLARSLGVEKNIRFLGYVENPAPLLKISSAFCLLSRSEGFSNALLEAMACGVPPVVSRVGGNPEAIVDEVSGFLVPPEDPDTAARRLLRLLRDPVRAARMGEEAQAAACSRFSAETMIHNLITLYNELMMEHG